MVQARPEDVDRVADLWKAMLAHHADIAGGEWPVRAADESWTRRRATYDQWLANGNGMLLLAVAEDAPESEPDGYAAVQIHPPGATFDLGQLGELDSLAVAPHARGTGIGTLLIDAARDALRRRGVVYWKVGVVEGNDGAMRLYEREGFRPFWRALVARIEPA